MEFLTKKYGPLPAWGWLAIVAGGAGVWVYLRNRNAAAAGTAAGDTTDAGPAGTGGSSGADGSLPAPGPVPPSSDPCSDPRNYRVARTPSGNVRLVCPAGGHFVKGPAGGYHWEAGPARRPPRAQPGGVPSRQRVAR